MDDGLAIGSHCGTLDGTVTLNIQIKNGMPCNQKSKKLEVGGILSKII